MNRMILMVLLLTLLAAPPCRGAAPAAPELAGVTLLSASGELFAAEQAGKEGPVLLVLIDKGMPGGSAMLDYLSGLDPQFPAGRLLVVVAGSDARVLAMISGKYPGLDAGWYRDPEGALARQLKLTVTPAVLGVRSGKVLWSQYGISDPELLEKSMRGWLNR